MNLSQEYRTLKRPTITEEEYICMRMAGMMMSEMASYDLAPPGWSFPTYVKQQTRPNSPIYDDKEEWKQDTIPKMFGETNDEFNKIKYIPNN